MNLLSPEARALLRKELRQITRSRRAMLSATLLPLLFMVIMPVGQFLSIVGTGSASLTRSVPAGTSMPPGFDTSNPIGLFTHFLLPLFIAMSGVVVPSVSATYTVVVERERRSLELLMALPVRVRDILVAKMVAMLVMACVVVLPLFALDAVGLLVTGIGSPTYVLLLLLVLVAALVCSIGIALLLALLARDFRTANNLNGAMVGPLVVVTMGVLVLVPGDAKLLVLAAVLALAGAATILVGTRWLTFERYLA